MDTPSKQKKEQIAQVETQSSQNSGEEWNEIQLQDQTPGDLEKQRRQKKESNAQDPDANPFGHEDENVEIRYQTMEWWHAGTLMVAETISLGVLSLPAAVAALGLFPGIFLIITLGLLSTYNGYVIGQFYLAFPGMHTFADAAMLIGGPIAREIMGVAQCLILIFIMAAHILSFSIMMNVLTDHGTCSVVFGFVGFIVCLALGLKRQLEKVAYLSVTSCLSVIIAVTIAMVGIGITKPGAGQGIVAINHDTSLKDGMLATLQIIVAYAGHVAFFTFCSELKDPRDFPKALIFMQVIATSFYALVGAVIYYYAGPHVLAPALGSASPTVAKVAFGVALPTIVIAGVVNGHVACKYIWVRVWRARNAVARVHDRRGWPLASWIAICTILWLLSWLIAEAIPSFGLLLGLISALFCSWFSYGLSGGLWLYMNRGRCFKSKRKMCLALLNALILFSGAAICGLGLYASGIALANGEGGKPFSCKDNYRPG